MPDSQVDMTSIYPNRRR